MTPSDFVFDSVYKGAKRAGATELAAIVMPRYVMAYT